MAQLSIWGGAVKTAQIAEIAHLEQQLRASAERISETLADVDYWRDRANTAEQDVTDARRDVEALQGDLIDASREIDRLKATALPLLDPHGEPVDGGPVQALIAEALDMEIGGEK